MPPRSPGGVTLLDTARRPVRLGAEIGRGGEAVVYMVADHPDVVAKVYQSPRAEYHDKLSFMRSTPPRDPTAPRGHASIAWPRDLLHDAKGRFAGYLMPRIREGRPIVTVFNPRRRAALPGFDERYLYRAARNLASAIAAVHACDYVVGDVNERNILVTPRALVSLIDTDSFQVQQATDTRLIVYSCPVGRSEYTPPELQGQAFAGVRRSVQHDAFGMGVLLFQLLMDGSHPFRGQWRGSGDPPAIEQRISRGWFPYGPDCPGEIAPPPRGPGLDRLHPGLAELFVRCFRDGHRDPARRPGGDEWSHALAAAEADLVTCPRGHVHAGHLGGCPTCGTVQAGPTHGSTRSGPGGARSAPRGSTLGGTSVVAPGTAAPVPVGSIAAGAVRRVGSAVGTLRTGATAAVARRRRALRALPARAGVAFVGHALRPRATLAMLRRRQQKMVRLTGMVVLAAGIGVVGGAAVLAVTSSPTIAELAPGRLGVPGLIAGSIALVATALARTVAAASDLRPGGARLVSTVRRAVAAILGAGATWIVVAVAASAVTLTPVSDTLLGPSVGDAARDLTLPAVVGGAAIYGAVAGALGGALRDDGLGWFVAGLVFGAVGCAALNLAAPLW
jgi:hypothetical protein